MLQFRERSLQGKLSRILIYVLMGFFVYFASNFVVSRIHRSYLVFLRDDAYPLLDNAEFQLKTLEKLKTAFTEAIISQDGSQIHTVDQLSAALNDSFDETTKIDPSLATDVNQLKQLYSEYFKVSKDLNDRVITGIADPKEVRQSGILVNSKYGDLMKALRNFRDTRYHVFTSTIDHAKSASDMALLLGFCMFLVAIGVCIIAMKYVMGIAKSLDKMGWELQGAAEKLAYTSENVHKSGTALSDNTREQSEAAAETVATTEQIQQTLDKNVRESEVALESAHKTLTNAQHGQHLVQNMLQEMSEIEKANDQLGRITGVMEQIVEKTNVINEIVLQSRILSFNANIEAARAGEFGKGFSVVATEVAKLADMTGTSSIEIQELLEKSSKEVFDLIQNTNNKVRVGQESSRNCEKAFGSISNHVADLVAKVEFIVNSSRIQATAVQQITQAMRMIDDAAQKNHRSVSKTVDITADLDGQSAELLENVCLLNELVKGSAEPKVDRRQAERRTSQDSAA
jgi:hypothetical protein